MIKVYRYEPLEPEFPCYVILRKEGGGGAGWHYSIYWIYYYESKHDDPVIYPFHSYDDWDVAENKAYDYAMSLAR